MKSRDHADELLDRTFAALRNVETPDGLEERIAETLRSGTENTTGKRKLGWRPATSWARGLGTSRVWVRAPGWAAGIAAGLVAGFVCVLMTSPRLTHLAKHAPPQAAGARRAGPEAVLGSQSGSRPATGVVAGQSVARVRQVRASQERATLKRTSPQRRDLAWEEAQAPSMLAPPMPLTASERLLQAAARRGGSRANSPLNPEVREKERLQAALEFKDFFTKADEIGPAVTMQKGEKQ